MTGRGMSWEHLRRFVVNKTIEMIYRVRVRVRQQISDFPLEDKSGGNFRDDPLYSRLALANL